MGDKRWVYAGLETFRGIISGRFYQVFPLDLAELLQGICEISGAPDVHRGSSEFFPSRRTAPELSIKSLATDTRVKIPGEAHK